MDAREVVAQASEQHLRGTRPSGELVCAGCGSPFASVQEHAEHRADRILAALAEHDFAVARLEQVGVWQDDAVPAKFEPSAAGWSPVFRVVEAGR